MRARKTPEEMKEWLNKKLEEKNQKLRVQYYSNKKIVLNNGVVLEESGDIRRFKTRIRHGSFYYDKGYYDKLYSEDSEKLKELEIEFDKHKREIVSEAGKANWERNREYLTKKFKGRQAWNKGLKGLKGKPHTEESKKAISRRNSGKNNGMYGHRHSEEEKRKKSEMMKRKILNGEFTPVTNNRNTHWESSYNGVKFRSSWECLYYSLNPNAEYEKLRIRYSLDGNEYVYIVDFIDHEKRVVCEVKPKSMMKDKKTQAKISALECWCDKNGYKMLIFDENYIIENVEYPEGEEAEKFDAKTLKKLNSLYKHYGVL